MAGNPIDNQTAGAMLAKIEERHGKAERPCFMDRGILTEAVLLESMRVRGRTLWIGQKRRPSWQGVRQAAAAA